jgi:hypothetical protein
VEALKFAFDTVIIGALALPWLVVLLWLYLPDTDTKADRHWALVSALPEHTKDAVLGVMILALGYFLGASIARISDDFFDDADLWSLPTEPSIREDVYYHEYCDVKSVLEAETLPGQLRESAALFCPKNGVPQPADWHKQWGDGITQFFRLEEGKLLLQGDEKTTRLRELHDQIMILRGATLNFMILSTLCLFGFCASFRSQLGNWRSFVFLLTQAPTITLIGYGAYALYVHFQQFGHDPDFFRDPPLAEGLMILVGIAGLLVGARSEGRWKYARGCALAFALMLVAYGSWWWTEVMYNQGIIHAFPTLSPIRPVPDGE